MTTLATAEKFINDKKVQKAIIQIEKDAEQATSIAKSVIKSSTGKLYSSTMLGAYQADVARLERCRTAFDGAWNKVACGKAKNGKDLAKTYAKFVLSLEVLELSNARHEAVMTTGLAVLAAALHALIIKWTKAKQKRLKSVFDELQALQKLLEKARREVKEAAAQAALNAALTAVTLCLGPVGWGARIGVAVVSMTAHHIIDASLGPNRGSVEGSLNTVAGDSAALVDKLSKGQRTFAGAASGVLTLGLDAAEIGDAVKIVEEIKKRIRVVRKQLDGLVKDSVRWNKDIAKAHRNYIAALKAYDTASKKIKRAGASRKELMKEFKAWK